MDRLQPLVSILMTSYNASLYIADAINSVLSQSYTKWELLIADDCSTDSTRDVIDTFEDIRIKVLHNDANMHYLRTRNKLLQYVEGEFITLLDADDLMHPDRLMKQVQAFDQDPDLGLCGTHVEFISEAGKPLGIEESKPLDYQSIRKEIQGKNVFTGSTIMVKTNIWKEVGGYRDYFNTLGYEDYDLTSRIIEKYKAINLPDKLYLYRQYEESSSKRDLLYNPFKLHGYKLVQKLIEQRKTSGTDAIEQIDIPFLINFIVNLNKPYVDDQSLIYRELMWSSLNKKLLLRALKNILMAIKLRPLQWKNWKGLILFCLVNARLIKG